MTAHARATFEVKGWEEQPYDVRDGLPKLTRASVRVAYQGDLEGEGTIEYLMAYREDGSATFVGVQRVSGALGGCTGTFVLHGTGAYEKETGTATMAWAIAPGSGTGDLRGISGAGGASATHTPPGALTLDYDLPQP